MAACRACSAENPERNHFCGVCGASLESASELPTQAMPWMAAPKANASFDEGRFPAGTVLASRYRIIGLVGQGGMGEVYRAIDLKLGQPVALKFLPGATADLLARFHDEVRIARQVSHPNVCRVYDIGEADGHTFLSMEYVDGEDLRSLLRRIGRLPGDKALELARKLCAGLAAAHDKHVLHRDLKPANVMIDGRGQMLITDFGLASVAGQLDPAQFRDGTPAYMAPEQLAGKDVSVQSDIYALGLVLHEMFTGKHAFEKGLPRTAPATLGSAVKDIDPLVERVILRCLEEDPRDRPPSALAVAAALPGGDALAAALAAGDTPTPGMVAAAGDAEGIPVRAAGICLAWILVGVVAAVMLNAKANVLRQTPFPYSTEILAQKAQEMLQSFGYIDRPADRAYEFSYDTSYQAYAESRERVSEYQNQLAKGQPAAIVFWYRQSPLPLVARGPDAVVSPAVPPPVISGMIGLKLDPQGRLLQLDAVPPQLEERPSQPSPYNWMVLFTAAGLDMGRFTAAEPQWLSLAGFDARAAWTGYCPSDPAIPMRIEAASWGGRPVYFQEIGPWSKPERMQPSADVSVGAMAVIVALSVLCALLAWRNFRAERGDIRGANRAAAFVFALAWLEGILSAHHVSSSREVGNLIVNTALAVLPAAAVWMSYLAFEPYVRRRWPQSLITWSRVLRGGFRDPLVGGHVLFGLAFGIGLALLNAGGRLTLQHYGAIVTNTSYARPLISLLDARGLADGLLAELILAFFNGMGLTFILMLLRVLLRRRWLAPAAFILIGVLAPSTGVGSTPHLLTIAAGMAFFALFASTLLRFGGLLTTIVCLFAGNTLGSLPAADFSAWYANTTIYAVIFFLALTVHAFMTAVAGRPIVRGAFLESD